MVKIVLSLIPLASLVVLYALLAKLAAWIFRRTALRWRHAFIFAAMLSLIGIVNMAAGRAFPPIAQPVFFVIAVSLQLALGGWFLGPRALSKDGKPIQFRGGVMLTLIMVAIAFVLAVALYGVLFVMQSGR
jgi:hypothetical protein